MKADQVRRLQERAQQQAADVKEVLDQICVEALRLWAGGAC
jgi:hypothetical protein